MAALTQPMVGTPMGYLAIRNRVLGSLASIDPSTPTAPGASGGAAPLPTAPFAPTTAAPAAAPAAPMPAAPMQAALSSRLNPQLGTTRVFPNGRTGKWDGTGWLHVG